MSGPLMEKEFNQIIRIMESTIVREQISIKRRVEFKSIDEKNLNEKFLVRYEDSPSVERFRDEYFNKNLPVIIENQIQHWPAMKNWR